MKLSLLSTLLLLPLLAGCAGVRSTVRGIGNASMVGQPAPALSGGEWILPPGADSGDVELADWKLIAIFKPT